MKIRSLGSAAALLAAALLAAALLAAMAGPASAQVKEHVFKVGTGLSEDHPQAKALKYFADQLAAKSGGKLSARVYTSGSLGNDISMTSALRGGTLEMTIPDSSTLVSLAKPFGVLNLPLTFNNEKEADAVLDGPFGQKLLATLPEKGLIGLGFWENGFRHVTNSRRPVRSADDLSGLKLRVIQSPLFLDTFNALGANATPMPFTTPSTHWAPMRRPCPSPSCTRRWSKARWTGRRTRQPPSSPASSTKCRSTW
jgi:TRAP-type transport system periplasmic protein